MNHPYSDLPKSKYWRKFVSDISWRDLNLNSNVKFELKDDFKVATAGSCFAQHIARYMRYSGLEIYNAEPAHPLIVTFSQDHESYNQFSARYGNIYTSRQCLELLLQATGEMPIINDFYEEGGRWFDLMRPGIQKSGYASLNEAIADRSYHMSRVKEMFVNSDVFIFTLGLTECWRNSTFGHTYPVCPGTVRGKFDPELHLFDNLNYNSVFADMDELIRRLSIINKKLKIILTVSPIPLVATRTSENVLIASSYSKSVLRCVAGDLHARFENVAYFPSFEIINSVCSFGQYLASDLREVTERGVNHVMNEFMKTYYKKLPSLSLPNPNPTPENDVSLKAEQFTVECEEVYNYPGKF